jgi:hypothetical protein
MADPAMPPARWCCTCSGAFGAGDLSSGAIAAVTLLVVIAIVGLQWFGSPMVAMHTDAERALDRLLSATEVVHWRTFR